MDSYKPTISIRNQLGPRRWTATPAVQLEVPLLIFLLASRKITEESSRTVVCKRSLPLFSKKAHPTGIGE